MFRLSDLKLCLTLMVSAVSLVACSGGDEETPQTFTPDGLANCYMVIPGDRVSIPITRAITIGGMDASSEATVEILWDDAGVISGSPTLSGSGASRKIRVKTSSTQGNAVIAIKGTDTGTIYWSWHIWVVDYDPNTGGTWTNNGYTFMDRNLGATDNQLNLASRGLLYQWGRKDPFPGGKEGTAGYTALSHFKGMHDAGSKEGVRVRARNLYDGILESVRNPTTFFSENTTSNDWLPQRDDALWNSTDGMKTVYDPCPVGWRAHITDSWKKKASPWYGLNEDCWIDNHQGTGYKWGPYSAWPDYDLRENDSIKNLTMLNSLRLTIDNTNYTQEDAMLAGSILYNASSFRPCWGFAVRCVQETLITEF